MSSALVQRFKSFVTSSKKEHESPELGFKISHNSEGIRVKILAARNLPSCYGFVKPVGYLVKVKVFPGREKFETNLMKSSSPYFDEVFMFPLSATTSDQFSGKFVTFTVYAILDQPENSGNKSKTTSFRNRIENFLSNGSKQVINHRYSLTNRRTIGAITFNLNKSVFTQNASDASSTPDIWRDIEMISSGVNIQTRESKKGSMEVTLIYSNSEDGKHDNIQISLTKFRCSMQTMQEYEKLSGLLYFKMVLYEYDIPVAKWKGNTFLPTISMKIESKSATMQATINNYNIDNIKIVIKLKCRDALVQKKSQLGTITVASGSQIWNQLIQAPTQPITQFFEFV